MENVFFEGQIIWAQVDANRHMRHSAYADYCAQARCNLLNEGGLSIDIAAENGIGPVLFREELKYLREIKLDEVIRVTVQLSKYNHKNSKFSFKHEIYRADGTKSAEVNVDGAWIDLNKRKLTTLTPDFKEIILNFPKTEDFEEIGKE